VCKYRAPRAKQPVGGLGTSIQRLTERADGVYADLIKVFLPSGKIDLKHLTASYGKKDPATLHDYLLRLLVASTGLSYAQKFPRRIAFAGEVTQKLELLSEQVLPEVRKFEIDDAVSFPKAET